MAKLMLEHVTQLMVTIRQNVSNPGIMPFLPLDPTRCKLLFIKINNTRCSVHDLGFITSYGHGHTHGLGGRAIENTVYYRMDTIPKRLLKTSYNM